MKEKIFLVGGGGHCHACIDVVEASCKYEVAGIFDLKENVGKKVLGYEVLGTDEDLAKFSSVTKNVLITLGQIKIFSLRMKKYHDLKQQGFIFPTIVSPRAYVSKHAEVAEGTIVMHDALVVAGAKIGRNCIINHKSLIEHDVVIGDFSHISTATVINGNCVIGEKSFVGSNAVLKEGVTVAPESLIPAGIFYRGAKV